MHSNMDYEAARELLLARTAPIFRLERVPLAESEGRILAAAVFAAGDVPPFDRSPYDGYAFRAEDTAEASEKEPVTLRIVGEIPAGVRRDAPLHAGEAVKILTGAPLPPGADAVTKFEDTVFSRESVTLLRPCRAGENVVRRGEDVRRGEPLASAGTVIDAALAGALASQGIKAPLCYGKLRVGLLTTGSELAEVEEPLTGGKIVNANRYTFTAALKKLGCEPVYLGAPGDSAEEIAACLRGGLESCDLLIATGGVSVGDYDVTPDAMELAGFELLLRRLRMKPGGACAYGIKDGVLCCALSGNPGSALVNFYAVALPALRKRSGRKDVLLPGTWVTLEQDYPKRSPRTRLIWGRLDLRGGSCRMALPEGQGNSALRALIGCNLLAVIPAGSNPLPAGTRLEAYYLG